MKVQKKRALKKFQATDDVDASDDPIIHFTKEVQNVSLGASVIHLVADGHKETDDALVMQARKSLIILKFQRL